MRTGGSLHHKSRQQYSHQHMHAEPLIGEERGVNGRMELVTCAKMVTTATNKCLQCTTAVLLSSGMTGTPNCLNVKSSLGWPLFVVEAIGDGGGNNMVC
eukprot:8989163-Ditylum_brightwellii.AAC.1